MKIKIETKSGKKICVLLDEHGDATISFSHKGKENTATRGAYHHGRQGMALYANAKGLGKVAFILDENNEKTLLQAIREKKNAKEEERRRGYSHLLQDLPEVVLPAKPAPANIADIQKKIRGLEKQLHLTTKNDAYCMDPEDSGIVYGIEANIRQLKAGIPPQWEGPFYTYGHTADARKKIIGTYRCQAVAGRTLTHAASDPAKDCWS